MKKDVNISFRFSLNPPSAEELIFSNLHPLGQEAK